jgi:tetratricopeptide (TPR) repeat protein/predicted Ser/Thr protein kinase
MIGETISHYRIIEQLGEGGMGVVYLAEDITLGRLVAMKFLTPTGGEYRSRFLREARAVSLLHHQNIAAVFDYGETPAGQPFIVMERIEGEPLSEKLRGGSLPLAEAARIVSEIAEALGEAHLQGVVHRDIKPSNVIINKRGQVKVVDFGLVKQIDEDTGDQRPVDQTRSDVIVGTPLYLSPEQATGKPVDRRSDLFALGAVLYECITGESAFSGSSVMEIGAQIIHVTPPVPSMRNDHVPPELDRITMKAIEKKAEARYQSADELIAELQAILPALEADGFRSRVRSTHPVAPARTHSLSALTTLTETIRQPRISWATVIIAFLALVFLAGAVIWWRRPVSYKPSPVALDWYNKGTEHLRNGEFLQASKALQEAIKSDPGFPLAHARLAEAWFELDYADKAMSETVIVHNLVPNRSELPQIDALYLDAISATATRNFPSAIKAYSEIVSLSPNEPHLHVDLGRAYEKNDELKLAIKSYETAITRLPQNPTAYLRVGVLYGDRMDLPRAMENFEKAQTLFDALGKVEGQAEVAFQRGFLLYRQSKNTEARPYLERALELATTNRSQYQEVQTILVLGNVFVEEKDFAQGRKLIQQAIDKARDGGIDRYVKRGLVDLGNSFLRTSEYAVAENYYRQSLKLSIDQKDNRNSARALLALSGVLSRQSKVAEAIQSLEQALPFYQQAGYRKEGMQAFNLWARFKQYQQGDYATAMKAAGQHLELAQQLDDSEQMLLAHGDLGLFLASQARYPEALTHFDQSYAIAKALPGDKDEALSLTNLANAYWALGRYEDADRYLGEAAKIAERPEAGKNMAAWFYLASAQMALSELDWPKAQAKAQKALDLSGTEIKDIASEAMSARGLARVLAGQIREGKADCEQAVKTAMGTTQPGLIAKSLLSLSQAYLQSGDNAGALKTSLESQETFSRLGALDHEWVAWLMAARASQAASDSQKSLEYREHAEAGLEGLQPKWGADNYNSYVKRQDIQLYLKWLGGVPLGKP